MIPKIIKMKNVFQKKAWLSGAVQVRIYLPPIPLIKSYVEKIRKNNLKIKLHRNPMSATSDKYELKMTLFENDEP